MASAAHRTAIECLPDALLGRIFAAAGRQAGPSVTLVSRRWHDVCYAEPALWRCLELAPHSLDAADYAGLAAQWFAAKARLLRRVGSFVQHLEYSQFIYLGGDDDDVLDMQQLAAGRGSQWQLASSVLAHLSPASLHMLGLQGVALHDAEAAELRRFNNLTGLRINCRDMLSGSFVAALPHLQRLQTFWLSGNNFPAGLAEALQRLPQLRTLNCDGRAPTLDLGALPPLTQLRGLLWAEHRRASLLQADVQQLLVRMPLLESWRLSSYSANSGTVQIGDAVLGTLGIDGYAREQNTVRHVTLYDIRRVPSLQQLVAAVLPADAQPSWLRSLTIDHSAVSQHALQGCAFLGHLTCLNLTFCKFAGQAEAVLRAVLEQAPRLQSLGLQGCLRRQPLPRALLLRTGLLHLDLRRNKLAQLESGPYLDSLVSLDLSKNKWQCVPMAVGFAANLVELSLGHCPDLMLTEGDVETLLRPPRLRRLYLDAPTTPNTVLAHLCQCAPELEISRHKPQRLAPQGQE